MPVNILVADDSVTMRRIFELAFAGEDAKVTTVDSGDGALAKATSLQPDVVFADLSMGSASGSDGYKVANAIKTAPGLERTAVILLASQKYPYDEAKGKAAGVDDHVVKPFDTQQLIDKLKRVLAQPRAAASKAAAPPVAPVVPTAPPLAAAPQVRPAPNRTIAFERAPGAAIPQPLQAAQPAAPARAPQTLSIDPRAVPPSSPTHVAHIPGAAAAATSNGGELAKKLDGLGLTAQQVDAVLSLSREVIEKIVWEVVPDLAETLIREEIRRLTR